MLPHDHEKMTISCLGLKIGWTIGCLGPQARESFSISSKPKQRFDVLESKNMNLLNSNLLTLFKTNNLSTQGSPTQWNEMGWKSSTNGKLKATEEQEFFFCVGGNTWRCCLWAPSFSKWLIYTILLLKNRVEFIKETTLFPLMPPVYPPNQLHNVTFLPLACLTTILVSKFSWPCWRNCLFPFMPLVYPPKQPTQHNNDIENENF
jgi:hypothetical protein